MKFASGLLLAAMALVNHASAVPGSQSSANLLAKRDCGDAYVALVLNGPCVEGSSLCEFCCPGLFDASLEPGAEHCHFSHDEPCNYCPCGTLEWHCDSS